MSSRWPGSGARRPGSRALRSPASSAAGGSWIGAGGGPRPPRDGPTRPRRRSRSRRTSGYSASQLEHKGDGPRFNSMTDGPLRPKNHGPHATASPSFSPAGAFVFAAGAHSFCPLFILLSFFFFLHFFCSFYSFFLLFFFFFFILLFVRRRMRTLKAGRMRVYVRNFAY
jgi:hypothetical protein